MQEAKKIADMKKREKMEEKLARSEYYRIKYTFLLIKYGRPLHIWLWVCLVCLLEGEVCCLTGRR